MSRLIVIALANHWAVSSSMSMLKPRPFGEIGAPVVGRHIRRLRSGFVTSALEDGADVFKVMDVTRHRAVATLREYDRRAKAFKDHAGKGFL